MLKSGSCGKAVPLRNTFPFFLKSGRTPENDTKKEPGIIRMPGSRENISKVYERKKESFSRPF